MITSFVTLTVGQTPRSDIMPLLDEYLPAEQVAHTGLLDGMTREQIEQDFSPESGEDMLVSCLLDGSQISLSSARVEQALQQKINWLEGEGCDTILLLGTDEFHHLRARQAMLLEPDRIIPPLIGAIVGNNQVGIVVPAASQIENQAGKWLKLAKKPCFAAANPYLDDEQGLIDAALSLRAQGAQVVVLDCIGYQHTHCDIIQKQLDVPVMLSNTLLAKLASELLM